MRPAEHSPEGWASVCEQILGDSDDLAHFWGEGGLMGFEIQAATSNPT
ncbi:hypothetical protein ACIRQH_38090 [Streptomyces sp. NPDC102279]